jgi:UDP-galactopyranose mutase
VKATNSQGVFGLPINLLTINQFFGKTMNPAEARAFVESLGEKSITDPQTFEEQALRFLGRDLYKTFFHGYTKKQWGCDPSELPASILKRLPIRFNYDDNYYNARYQGIPELGYSELIARILDAPGIKVRLGCSYEVDMEKAFDHVFYAGPIDGFFGHSLGRLRYRTVTFERIDAEGDLQGNAVINYTEESVPFTRIHEHKHFTPWETHQRTVAFREYSKATGPEDIPYYPLRLPEDLSLLEQYQALTSKHPKLTFIGRLGTYRYLDMDQVIGEALDLAGAVIAGSQRGSSEPWKVPFRSK